MVNALEPLLRVGGVAGHHIIVRVLQRNQPPLGVQLRYTDAVLYGNRPLFGKNCGAGIALFLGIVPILMVPRQFQIHLPRLEFGLLEAEEIRVRPIKILPKALSQAGPQAVDIPRNQFHLFFASCAAFHFARASAIAVFPPPVS